VGRRGRIGVPAVVGQSNPRGQDSEFGRVAHEVGIYAVEHEFGSPEHVEGTVVVDVSPSEVNEAITAFAMHGRSTEVDRAITLDDGADIEFPSGIGGITPHQVLGLSPDLDTDMDVEERCAVGIAERPSWQIRADHHDSHNDQSGSILRDVCAFVVG
jgi:hypothetical protein